MINVGTDFNVEYVNEFNEILKEKGSVIRLYPRGYVVDIKLEKDGYDVNIYWNGRSDNATSFDVEIVDKKTGVLEYDINYNVKDEFINSDYGITATVEIYCGKKTATTEVTINDKL